MTQTKRLVTYTFIIMMALLLAFAGTVALAQQGGGSGSSGSGASSGDQQQDRDRIQDPATHDGDEKPQESNQDNPDQDRLRNQLQDGTGDNCDGTGDCDGTPDQDRLQTQDRDRLQDTTGDGTPDQDRLQTQDRDRLHVDSTAALEQYVGEQQRTRLQTQTEDGQGNMVRTRTEAQIAADAVVAAEPLLGRNGPRMSEVAQEVNQAMNGLGSREEALQNRSRLQLFFFGQDGEAVAAMQQEMEQNQNRIQEMKQLMLNCDDCDQEATQFLVNQIQNMEREQARVQQVADDASQTRGLFGFLFGWMR